MVIITDSDTDKTESALYESQRQYLLQHYGTEAAENANYGWAVEIDDSDPFIAACTKVYGIGYLHSEAHNMIEHGGTLEVTHEFEPLSPKQ